MCLSQESRRVDEKTISQSHCSNPSLKCPRERGAKFHCVLARLLYIGASQANCNDSNPSLKPFSDKFASHASLLQIIIQNSCAIFQITYPPSTMIPHNASRDMTSPERAEALWDDVSLTNTIPASVVYIHRKPEKRHESMPA
jgi:hypothetical protein